MILSRQNRFRLSRYSCVDALIVVTFLAVQTCEAQLFGGKGLLNRKTEAPRVLTEEEIGLPTAVTGRVEVLKGTEATFEIRAETKTPGAAVEFLIRTFPSAGKIVSLTSNPNARNRAIVTYFANPESSAEKDAFSFAVRYRGGRYTSAMRFDIDLVDTNAEIQIEKEVEFGSAMIGDSVKKELTVSNLGNGIFERQLYLSPPWFLTEPKDGQLVLRPRESKRITISFRPQMIGETSYFLSLSRSKSGTTKLFGEGLDPFTVVSEEIELTLDPDTHTREGEIILLNGGSRPILVQANGSTRLQQTLKKEYILAAGKETRIPVSLGSTDAAPFDGMVQFRLKNGYMKTARVVSAVVPGRLEVSVPDSLSAEIINFGKVEGGKSMERVFTLSNTGGVALPLEFHLPEPFRMLNDPGTQLPPLSSVNIAVGLFPETTRRGMVDVTLNVYGNEQIVPIRLLGNVVKAKKVASLAIPQQSGSSEVPSDETKLSVKADSPTQDEGLVENTTENSQDIDSSADQVGNMASNKTYEVEQGDSPPPAPSSERQLNPSLSSPEDLSILERDSNSLTIGWTAPKDSESANFEVEFAGLQAGHEFPTESVWIPYRNVTFERIGRLVKAQIQGLSPASTYKFRVVMLDGQNASSSPSEALVASTDLPTDRTFIYIGVVIIALFGLTYSVVNIYRIKNPKSIG